MDIKKTFSNMGSRISGQLESRLQKVDLESLLGAVGLQMVKRAPRMALPLIAAFTSGVAFGAIFSPTSGKELRAGIGKLVARAIGATKSGERGPEVAHELADGANGEAAESPYDKAHKAAQRDPSGTNGQKKGVSAPDPTVS